MIFEFCWNSCVVLDNIPLQKLRFQINSQTFQSMIYISNKFNNFTFCGGMDSKSVFFFSESATPSWKEFSEALEAVQQVVAGLVEFIHQYGNRKLQDTTHSQHAKYKISMCRDLTLRGSCPRSTNCTFAHSNEELEKYRAKNRKTMIRNKEHRIDSQSPSEKSYNQPEDYYTPVPNTAAPSPVSMPAMVAGMAQGMSKLRLYRLTVFVVC